MKRYWSHLFILVLSVGLLSCGKGEEPEAQLPSYLSLPSTLAGYRGSGQLTLSGDLSLHVEGPEQLDPATDTYSGILASIRPGYVLAQFTAGQPLAYAQSATVPAQYEANGELSINNTSEPGTYPMGIESEPTPTGVIADLTINLPGPQLYYTRSGSLTITNKTLIQEQDGNRLYRIQGTFRATLDATGRGTTPGKALNTSGTFDLLLVSSL
jgi:hypothetical protein